MYIADLKLLPGYMHSLFLLRYVNPASQPMVRCYSICLPRRVADWMDHSRQQTDLCPVSTTLVISAGRRLMYYDAKISGARIRTHDLKTNVPITIHHSAPTTVWATSFYPGRGFGTTNRKQCDQRRYWFSSIELCFFYLLGSTYRRSQYQDTSSFLLESGNRASIWNPPTWSADWVYRRYSEKDSTSRNTIFTIILVIDVCNMPIY